MTTTAARRPRPAPPPPQPESFGKGSPDASRGGFRPGLDPGHGQMLDFAGEPFGRRERHGKALQPLVELLESAVAADVNASVHGIDGGDADPAILHQLVKRWAGGN